MNSISIKVTLLLSAPMVGGLVMASPGESMNASMHDLIRFDETDRTEWRVINDGVSYSAPFETTDGQWTTVRIPFAAFSPTFRGRTPTGAPQLDTKRIHQLAFLLADGQPGSFRLEIESVRAWSADGEDSR